MPSTSQLKRPLRQPMSLAWRLTLTYAASTGLLVLVAAGLMYNQLKASLRHENVAYLREEVRETQSDLQQPLATPAMIRRQIESDSPSEGDAFPTYMRILTPDGQVVGQTPGMDALAPRSIFPAVAADDISNNSWVTVSSVENGRWLQTGSVAAQGAAGAHYVVQIAMDLSEEANLLAQYRARIWAILPAAMVAAVVAGYLLAHYGLRPLRQVARAVRRVESTTLDHRLEPAGLPAELAKVARSFNDMLQRIEDAFARLSRFSADIAHELRTPLGCIRGELEVAISRARSPEEYREALGSCLEECVRLGHLIDRLLFLARAERQEALLNVETVDLDRELQNVQEFYEAAASESGVSLTVQAPPGLQARVDRTLLQSALGNLVENAIAHTPNGGSVKISGTASAESVCLEVADTGQGISADHLPFVTDRFYRIDGARSREGGHAGLGLAIVKSIASLHGGRLEIQSDLGRGTRVAMLFPVSRLQG